MAQVERSTKRSSLQFDLTNLASGAWRALVAAFLAPLALFALAFISCALVVVTTTNAKSGAAQAVVSGWDIIKLSLALPVNFGGVIISVPPLLATTIAFLLSLAIFLSLRVRNLSQIPLAAVGWLGSWLMLARALETSQQSQMNSVIGHSFVLFLTVVLVIAVHRVWKELYQPWLATLPQLSDIFFPNPEADKCLDSLPPLTARRALKACAQALARVPNLVVRQLRIALIGLSLLSAGVWVYWLIAGHHTADLLWKQTAVSGAPRIVLALLLLLWLPNYLVYALVWALGGMLSVGTLGTFSLATLTTRNLPLIPVFGYIPDPLPALAQTLLPMVGLLVALLAACDSLWQLRLIIRRWVVALVRINARDYQYSSRLIPACLVVLILPIVNQLAVVGACAAVGWVLIALSSGGLGSRNLASLGAVHQLPVLLRPWWQVFADISLILVVVSLVIIAIRAVVIYRYRSAQGQSAQRHGARDRESRSAFNAGNAHSQAHAHSSATVSSVLAESAADQYDEPSKRLPYEKRPRVSGDGTVPFHASEVKRRVVASEHIHDVDEESAHE